jgi:large subunit ribosomal protein L22
MGISYSVEADPETTAKAMLRERPVSFKHSKAVAREIKGMTLGDAREYLEAVKRGERSVPFTQHNDGVGHRSDIEGWDAGRFPEKASQAFLDLLSNGANNAEQQGFEADGMTIAHVAAHKVGEQRGMNPQAYGQAGEWNTPQVDVELVLEEVSD